VRDAERHDDQELEAGRLLFSRPCTFMLGAAQLSQLPDSDLPEVCFAGRSNVGKSSLINALTGTQSLARTSNTPGRTQELNFFNLAERILICDLPGYGYAQAPKERVKRWTMLVKDYLRGRPNLRRVLLLIDSRHGVKDNDHEIMDMLDEAAVNFQVVLTKMDKLKVSEAETIIGKTQTALAKHVAAHPEILTTSSEKGLGLAEVRAAVTSLALPLS
jgi:GTP-binding protein